MKEHDGGPGSLYLSQVRYLPAVFWGLLAVTAAVRMIGITRPLLGNFATKNCIYAMIARNWAEGRAGLLYPTLDVLKGGSRGLHMLEWPVSALVSGGLWRLFGGSLDVWGRATAVALSVGSVALVFLFVGGRHGQTAATGAALMLAFSPVSIIYGQSFMLEASLVFFTVGAFYALDRFLAGGRAGWLPVAGVLLAMLFLTKVYMLVVLLPLAVTAIGWQRTPRLAARSVVLATLLAAVLPAALWCVFAYETASPDSPFARQVYYSVRQSVESQAAAYWLLGSPEFYRQALDDLGGVVLTPLGLMLMLAGLLDRQWRQYAVWLGAMVLLVLALPRKFHEMNYYYMAVLPPLCIVAGLGWQAVRQRIRPGRTAVFVLLGVGLVFSLRYCIRPAFVTPAEDCAVLEAARQVQRLTGPDEPVVTMHGTTIDLLYYCNRRGWAIAPDGPQLAAVLEDCRRQGARYLVVVGAGPALRSAVAEGEGFRIHRLPPE